MHFLVTGHTGFKGSWLSIMLSRLGHTVSGLALDPEPASLFVSARVTDLLSNDIRSDIRDPAATCDAVSVVQPDVVIHLAAQPLVRESYLRPRETVETNVNGTLNVLEASTSTPSVRALLVVTTDKVYRNVGRVAGYAEDEPLGGEDPYSASKAMADILTFAWATSFPTVPTAIGRAGNVIGGGDYSTDRLVPDIVAAFESGNSVQLRYPEAVRPWQHVADCLNGYLSIVRDMLRPTSADQSVQAWNIGPGPDSFKTVAELTDTMSRLWDGPSVWEADNASHPHEAQILALDATRAHERLGWSNQLDFAESVAWTVDWYAAVAQGADPLEITFAQIDAFFERTNANPLAGV